jgi:succinyl-CoA synthetase alpha subunit
MPIFVHRDSRVICQGMVNEHELFWVHQCLLYGTNIVSWVKADFGGEKRLNIPVFDSVREARRQTNASVSLISVTPALAADAIIEAVEADIELIVCLTPKIPSKDMIGVYQILKNHKASRLIGPGSCGLMTPLQCKAGFMPAYAFAPGSIGMISCSDTLGYEIAWKLSSSGVGISTFVGLGSDAFAGTSILSAIREFETDSHTESILLVLQGGLYGIDAVANWARQEGHKPIFAIVAGHSLSTLPSRCPAVVDPPSDGGYVENLLQGAGVAIVDNLSLLGSKENS